MWNEYRGVRNRYAPVTPPRTAASTEARTPTTQAAARTAAKKVRNGNSSPRPGSRAVRAAAASRTATTANPYRAGGRSMSAGRWSGMGVSAPAGLTSDGKPALYQWPPRPGEYAVVCRPPRTGLPDGRDGRGRAVRDWNGTCNPFRRRGDRRKGAGHSNGGTSDGRIGGPAGPWQALGVHRRPSLRADRGRGEQDARRARPAGAGGRELPAARPPRRRRVAAPEQRVRGQDQPAAPGPHTGLQRTQPGPPR